MAKKQQEKQNENAVTLSQDEQGIVAAALRMNVSKMERRITKRKREATVEALKKQLEQAKSLLGRLQTEDEKKEPVASS